MVRERVRVSVRGAVQGVGFRPSVYRLARELALTGWVLNSDQGVLIEAEGDLESVRLFQERLGRQTPPRAIVQDIAFEKIEPNHDQSFEVRGSESSGSKRALILPDIATCADCQREIFDQTNRRFRYPFTNCTNCGPRFSIIESVPYDRANTSMKKFAMCDKCEREYHDPGNRRFQAQPNACPRCGPELEFWDPSGQTLQKGDAALLAAADAIRNGKIVALKGIGGFQLLVEAGNEKAVQRLRERKKREEKPFALMSPSLASTRQICSVSEAEAQLLTSPEAPIVLLAKDKAFADSAIAPDNPFLGVMLPYSPLHHLILRELNLAVVATSGNRSDEPICTDEGEALERLHDLADFFLVHNRPIVRNVDDSIVRMMAGREMMLRRARGYAPLPIPVKTANPGDRSETILALGAHLKNTVALALEENVFISQHLGDLETTPAHDAFRQSAHDLPRLYDAKPQIIACDLHPEYLSTKFAHEIAEDGPITAVPHHWAHVAATMAEHELAAPLLGVSWDGTGYGVDGTIWGGEFLEARDGGAFHRVAHLRTFRLPGGGAAIREPRRSALGLLDEIFGETLWEHSELTSRFSASELPAIRTMLKKNVNSPITSSAGRLFDAVAALLNLRQRSSFEGQAAMMLEFAAVEEEAESYPFALREDSPLVLDWEPMIHALLCDLSNVVPLGVIAARFHHSLAQMILSVARAVGQKRVVLGGGCFQNRRLTEMTIQKLRAAGFDVFWPQRLPPNDGGISFGQVAAVRMQTEVSDGT